jgi:hypothetical protein
VGDFPITVSCWNDVEYMKMRPCLKISMINLSIFMQSQCVLLLAVGTLELGLTSHS